MKKENIKSGINNLIPLRLKKHSGQKKRTRKKAMPKLSKMNFPILEDKDF
ncbi:MAG: hypothetical protein ACQETL_03265 [Bacteroidota bacterium]